MNTLERPIDLAAVHAVDLDLLRTFVAIAESRSFSRAAERVGRTPSAVSMQVKKLEENLGCAVFVRDSRSVDLTAQGEVLLTYARRLIALSNEMMSRFIAPDMEGTLTLGAPDDYAEKLIGDVLKRFSETHPNVQVNVVLDASLQLFSRFRRGELDLMIFTGCGDEIEKDSIVLLKEELVFAGVRGGTAHLRDPIPLSMWQEGCAWRTAAIKALEDSGRPWRTAYMTAHVQAQIAAVAADLAIAPFAKSFIKPPLVCLGDADGLPSLGTYDIRMKLKDNPGKITRAVADHVIALFDSL